MRNSDPRLWIIFSQRPDSNFNSMFAVQITGRDFQYGSDSCISPESILLVVMIHHLLEECIQDKPLCESVWNHQCLSSWNIVPLQQPVSIQNLLTLFSCESNFIRSSYRCNRRFWCDGMSFSKRTSALISPRTIDWPINTSGCPIYLDGFQILHTCLQLLPRNWADWQKQLCQNVSIVGQSAVKCIDNFPCPLLLRLHLNNGVVARKIGHPLSANSNNILSAKWSQIPSGLLYSIEDHFFSEPGPINDHCPIPNFFANMETTLAFATFFFIAFTVTRNVVEHWHK